MWRSVLGSSKLEMSKKLTGGGTCAKSIQTQWNHKLYMSMLLVSNPDSVVNLCKRWRIAYKLIPLHNRCNCALIYPTINSIPLLFLLLFIAVPPDISDYQTSTDMVVREGSNVTLRCAASGTPHPSITWRRENGEPISLSNAVEGDFFSLNLFSFFLYISL